MPPLSAQDLTDAIGLQLAEVRLPALPTAQAPALAGPELEAATVQLRVLARRLPSAATRSRLGPEAVCALLDAVVGRVARTHALASGHLRHARDRRGVWNTQWYEFDKAVRAVGHWLDTAAELALAGVSPERLRPPAVEALIAVGTAPPGAGHAPPFDPEYTSRASGTRARWLARVAALPGPEAEALTSELLGQTTDEALANAVAALPRPEQAARVLDGCDDLGQLRYVVRGILYRHPEDAALIEHATQRVSALLASWTDPDGQMVHTHWGFFLQQRPALSDAARRRLLDLSMASEGPPERRRRARQLPFLAALASSRTLRADELQAILRHPALLSSTPIAQGLSGEAQQDEYARLRREQEYTGRIVDALLAHREFLHDDRVRLLARWQVLQLQGYTVVRQVLDLDPHLLLDEQFTGLHRSVHWSTVLERVLPPAPAVPGPAVPGPAVPESPSPERTAQLIARAASGLVDDQGPSGLLNFLADHPHVVPRLPWAQLLEHERVKRSPARFRLQTLLARAGPRVGDTSGLDPLALMAERIDRIRSGNSAVLMIEELLRDGGGLFQQLAGAHVLRLVQLAALGAEHWPVERWARLRALRTVRLAGEPSPRLMPEMMRTLLRPHLQIGAFALASPGYTSRLAVTAEVAGMMSWVLPPLTSSSELGAVLGGLAPVLRQQLLRDLRGQPYTVAHDHLEPSVALDAVRAIPGPGRGATGGRPRTARPISQ